MNATTVDESSGTLSAPQPVIDLPCPMCEARTVLQQVWQSHSGGFEDYKHTCRTCEHVWWVDGIDS